MSMSFRLIVLGLATVLLPQAAGIAQEVVIQPVERQQAVADDAAEGAKPVAKEPLEKPLADEKPESPLKKLFRGIFNRPPNRILPRAGEKPENEEGHAETAEEEERPNVRDHIDRCAPHSPELEKLLARARRQMDSGNYKIAVEMLQQILDLPDNDRISTGPGTSALVRDEINRLIAGFPADARELYQLQYGGIAQRGLQESLQSNDPRRIAEIAGRYLHTPAGAEAADYVAARHVERGEWALAAAWYRRILEFRPDLDHQPIWFLKAALAFRQAGLSQAAATQLAELEGLASMRLGGSAANPREWLERLPANDVLPTPQIGDWRMLQGRPDRRAVFGGEPPVLVPRWEAPTTQSRKIRDRIVDLVADLRDSGRTPLPTSQPVLIGGQAVFRTLKGAVVVDLETGDRRWESRGGYTPEELLTGQTSTPHTYTEAMVIVNGDVGSYVQSGNGVDFDPLTGLLFRNGVHGLLSSDGRRLYVIEQQVWMSQFLPGQYYGDGPEQQDPLKRSWTTNKLAAYNLETGRVTWEIGGESLQEPFDLPLAGSYFLGVPLVAGDDLFVIAEKENEIRLICLDSVTGHPEWSQLIGYSLHSLDRDFGRRWYTAQPTLADGVVICPTTTGWLVAVDTVSRSILWEHRYQAPQPQRSTRRRGGNDREGLVQQQSLNSQWYLSAPLVAGDKVLFTPPEEDVLVCLDLTTGERLGTVPRQSFLALVGMVDDRLILLSNEGLTAIRFEPGEEPESGRAKVTAKTQWKTDLAAHAAHPSGMPALTREYAYLPLDNGELLQIALADGQVSETFRLAPRSRPLGNLSFHAGRLLSLDPLGARAFDLQATYDAEIARRRQQDPEDPWCLLQEAAVRNLAGQPEDALVLLDRVDAGQLAERDGERFRREMFATLYDLTRAEPAARGELFQRLPDYVTDERSRMQFRQLQFDRLLSQGDFREAFTLCLELADTEDGERLVGRPEDSRIRVRFSLWLGGRLGEILEQAPAEAREAIDAEIAARAVALDVADTAAVTEFLDLFAAHPSAAGVRQTIGEQLAAAGEFAAAERQFQLLTAMGSAEVQAAAWLRLADLYHEHQRPEAVLETLERLDRGFAEVVLDGRTVSATVADLRQQWQLEPGAAVADADWGDFDLTAHSSLTNYRVMQRFQARVDRGAMPLLDDFRVDYNNQNRRLLVSGASAPQDVWSVALRDSHSYYREVGKARSSNHLLLFLQATSITALSPVERRVLWSRSLGDAASSVQRYYYRSYSSGNSIPSMQQGRTLLNHFGLLKQDRRDNLVALTEEYLCVRLDRELQVFDTLTGRLLWTYDKLPDNSAVFGTDGSIFVIPLNKREESFKLRVADAARFGVGDKVKAIEQAVHYDGNEFVLADVKTKRSLLGKSQAQVELRRVDLETGTELWKTEFDGEFFVSQHEDTLILFDRKEGRLSQLNLTTGEQSDFGVIAAAAEFKYSETIAVPAGNRVYLILNDRRQNRVYGNGYLPSVFVNGKLCAIDRRTGEQLWTTDVKEQYLLLDLVEDSPVLLFSARKFVQRNNIGRTMQAVLALDRRSGRTLFEQEGLNNSDVQAVALDHQNRRLSLLSYSERLVLEAVEPQATEAPRPKADGDSAPPSSPESTSSGAESR